MLLPTITYGFAIIYSFGKQGLITKLFGRQLFDLYGFWGLLLGYLIYTLPVSFLLVSVTMEYIDKKFSVVSRIMGDKPGRPLWGRWPARCREPWQPPLCSAFSCALRIMVFRRP